MLVAKLAVYEYDFTQITTIDNAGDLLDFKNQRGSSASMRARTFCILFVREFRRDVVLHVGECNIDIHHCKQS